MRDDPSGETCRVSLTSLKRGQKGKIVAVEGGRGAVQRLEALDIRPGKSLIKISESFLKGPVMVQVGHSRLAVGYGMAGKVIVEVE